MIQLSSFKGKLSWPWVAVIALYLGAAISLAVMFWPNKREVSKLQSEIERLGREEHNLLRLVEQRPNLERQLAELEERFDDLAKEVPSQYDLPAVLAALSQLATYHGVSMDDLSHVPPQVTQGSSSGVIPLTLDLSGNDHILAYLVQLQEILPSLRIVELILGYGGDKQFHAKVRADLQVIMVDQASHSRWELQQIARVESSSSPITGFGLPFEIVAKFLARNVRVLGVVEGSGRSSALLSQDGTKQWVRVGDRLGEAVVSRVFPEGVVLDVDGVLLNLTIGG